MTKGHCLCCHICQFIQYRLCSCLDNIFSTSLHLTTACCSWMSMPRWEDFAPEVPVAPAKRPQLTASQVRLPCSWGSWRACQEVTGSNFANPPCSCIHCSFTSTLWCSFLLLQARAAIWYHISQLGSDALVALFWLLSVAQVPALASSLLQPGATLINKTFVLLFITVLRSLSFLIPR